MNAGAHEAADAGVNPGKVGNRVAPDDSDHKYFALLPHVVLAYCRSPHDLALWVTIKMITGEDGECILSTEDLGEIAGMSSGKVSDCRAHLLRVGLLIGRLYRDPNYPQPVWHLRIPDLWPRNVAWRRAAGDGLRERIAKIRATRASLQVVKAGAAEPSPGEGGVSPGEGGVSPGEAKKNVLKPKEEGPGITRITPREVWDSALVGLRPRLLADTYAAWLQHTAGVSYVDNVFTIAVENDRARDWLTKILKPRIEVELTRALGVTPSIDFQVTPPRPEIAMRAEG